MTDQLPNSENHSGFPGVVLAYLIKGPELEFLVDLLKNSVVFLGILLIAAALSSAVEWVEQRHYPWLVINSLWLVENLLFIGDIIWFSCKVVVSTISETI